MKGSVRTRAKTLFGKTRQDAPPDILKVRKQADELVCATDVQTGLDQMSVHITVDLQDTNPLVICVLNGGLFVSAEILKRLAFPLEFACVHVSRYQPAAGDTPSDRAAPEGGELVWHARPDVDLTNRLVLFLDDVLDHGVTLAALHTWAEQSGARAVRTGVLVRKQLPSQQFDADYVAVECPDRYLFGCGMDVNGYWRNLPAIHAMAETS